MRHNKWFGIKAVVLLSAWQLLAVQIPPATHAAQFSWSGAQVIGRVRLAPLERLQRDFAFLAEGVDGSSTTKIRELFSELSEGVDASRPAGGALVLDETFVPMIFLPLKDEERLFAVLGARFGWTFHREADGFYRSSDTDAGSDLVARVAGPWVYITGASHREMLRDVPADPTTLFEGIDPTLTAHASFRIDRLPEAMHTELVNRFSEAYSASDGSVLIEQWARRLLAETKSLEFELQCFRPLEQFHLTSRLTAIEGSSLERWIDSASQRPALFSQLPSGDSIFAMVSSLKLDAESMRPLIEAWEPMAAKAQAAVPSPRSREYTERLLGRVVAQAVGSVTATLENGELDAGFVVERQGRDQVVLLAGATFQGARALEQTATELGTQLQQSAEFRALEWSMGGGGDVSIHQFTVPVADASAQRMFGDPVRLAVGVGTEKLYVALGGEDTLTRLAEAVDRSHEDAPERGEVVHIAARMAPLLAVLDAVSSANSENDRNVHEYAKQIAPYKKNDTLELSLRAGNQALEGRLRVDMGIVRMLAAKLPVEAATGSSQPLREVPGTLQLRTDEQFQLEFRSENQITTTIDGKDRLDLSVHSLTYDFRVIRVDADGTMYLETSLSRATIDKTAPEGRESFDSKNPPEQEQMTAEMLLYGAVIGEPFVLTVQPDGTIAEISGIQQAVENVLDLKLKPSANEREQARVFVAQLLNEAGLRDSLTRGFEFYPGHKVSAGDRWTRTSENLALINFLLDNHYQMKEMSADQLAISVRSQVREPDADGVADQPVHWEIVGSQSGTMMLDPRNGRLRLAEYTLRLDAEATFAMDGKTVARPMVSVVKMTVGDPREVAQKAAANTPAASTQSANWLELTGDLAQVKWRPNPRDSWLIEGHEIISRGGNDAKWSYCEYSDQTFSDFELVADVQFGPGCNGGICVRATSGGLDGVNPSGYEVQLLGINTDRNPTGSIYKMPAKGRVSGLYSAQPGLAQPNQWISVRVVAQGTKLTAYIDNKQVATCDDQRDGMRSGHIILQGSPEGTIRYRDVRVRPL